MNDILWYLFSSELGFWRPSMQDLSSQPGIKPVPPAVEAQILNHWSIREFPELAVLCWMEVVRVGILVLFLILGEKLSVFHHWLCCCLVDKLCPTLCDPMDYSHSGSSVRRISQARTLQWVALSFFRGSSQPRARNCISCGPCISRRILHDWATRKPHWAC